MPGGKDKRKRTAADVEEAPKEAPKRARMTTLGSKPAPRPSVVDVKRRGPPDDDPMEVSERSLLEAWDLLGDYYYKPLPEVVSSKELKTCVSACKTAHKLLVCLFFLLFVIFYLIFSQLRAREARLASKLEWEEDEIVRHRHLAMVFWALPPEYRISESRIWTPPFTTRDRHYTEVWLISFIL